MKKIVIAIDGYSSCGKSTLAKALAKSLAYTYIDSGAMYRAVTYYFLQNDIDIKDLEQVKFALEKINIEFKITDQGNRTILNGIDIEDHIRKMYVSNKVSDVAAISMVRRAMVAQQRLLSQNKGVVMDGRDIGTVVFKDAALKIFVTADPDIRAQRRFDELKRKNIEGTLEEIKANLKMRDRIDSTREDSPLKQAPDAIVIDNSHLTETQQLEKALELAKEQLALIC